MRNEEHDIQKAICEYLDIRKVCYWAVPNGGNRSKREAGRLKAEGVKPGVPDITVINDGMYYGLEVKKPSTSTPKGYLSKAQKDRIQQIEEVGGGTVKVVYSVADVILTFAEWQLDFTTRATYEAK
tara:strand:- start:483 stop:860 length:378 start_codon:yes stop_codon:yes gene_type:complete